MLITKPEWKNEQFNRENSKLNDLWFQAYFKIIKKNIMSLINIKYRKIILSMKGNILSKDIC